MLLYKKLTSKFIMNMIESKLEVLPILPQKINTLFILSDEKNYDNKKLLKLIEKDAILVARLLQLANSKYFGFYNKVYTPSQALNLFGFNFTVSICIIELIFNSLRFDLKAYDISYFEFRKLTDISLKVLYELFGEDEASLKEQLIIPLYLQHIGRFIISDYICEQGKKDSFLNHTKINNISFVEKSMTAFTSYELSSLILKKWGMPKDILELLNNLEKKNPFEKYYKEVEIINIINFICDLKRPFMTDNIRLAIKEINNFDFDVLRFKKAVESLKKDFVTSRS